MAHNTINPSRNPADIQREALAAKLANDAWKASRDKMLATRSYTDLYKPLAIIAILFIGLTSLYSGITEFAYFYSFGSHKGFIGSILTGIFAGSATIIIEAAKNYLLYLTFYKIFKEKTLAYFPLLSALMCSIVSVFFSYKGAEKVAKLAQTQLAIHTPQLINVDSIAAAYNTEIAKNEAAIKLVRTQNTRTTGEIRSTGQKNINDIAEQNKLLLTNREKAVQAAQKTNADSIKAAVAINTNAAIAHQQTATELVESMALLSIIAELVLWGLSAFYWHYNVQSWYEDGAPDLSPSPQSPTPTQPNGDKKENTQHNSYTQPNTTQGNTPHSAPQAHWQETQPETQHTNAVFNPNFDVSDSQKTAKNTTVLDSHTTAQNTADTAEKTTVIHSKNNTEKQPENTVENNTEKQVVNCQIDAKNTTTSDVDIATENSSGKLRVLHPNTGKKTTQVAMFEQAKKDNSELVYEINCLMQRRGIVLEEIDAKGKLIVSFLYPDKNTPSGYTRKKSTPTLDTHYKTYLTRAAEYERDNKTAKAAENRERAAVYADVLRYLELQELAKNQFSNQQIG